MSIAALRRFGRETLGLAVVAKVHDDEAAQRLIDEAAKWEGPLASAFIDVVMRLRDRVSIDRLADALGRGGLPEVLKLLDLESFARELEGTNEVEGLRQILRETIAAGARMATRNLPKSIGANISFDLLNPRAVAAIRRYEFGLIREITRETRLAVQDAVLEGFQGGRTVEQQARRIHDAVGLTRSMARAVTNFRAQLTLRTQTPDGRPMQPVQARRLNAIDRRRALAIVAGRGEATQAEIDELVERYDHSLTRRRALNIARTETIRASAAGQQELWQQATDKGLLDPKRTRRMWITAGDERVREDHRKIPGMNPDGVLLDQPFATPMGPVMNPPAGVNCRCAVVLRFLDAE